MEEINICNDIPYSKNGDRDQDEKLLQPFKYILQVPGKHMREKLAKAFNYWLKIPSDKLNVIVEIVQILHNSSLLLDDIQDNSVLRRGIPVAHSIYGIPSTINAANYVIFIALEKTLSLDHPNATQVYTEQLLELHRGQGMEIYWRDNFLCPSESEYKQMTMKKTGGLFMLAVRLMQLFSDNKSDFSKIAGIIGLIFQIRDDYGNLMLKEFTENKSFCEDLTEGKFSFPIMHAIRNRPDDGQVMQILRLRTKDVDVKKYCVSLLEKFGSFAYTRETLENLVIEAKKEIDRLGGNPHLDALLNEFCNWNPPDREE
ncbi:geranylgeranyl pyrophosphate synthase, putative [Pediculus humanus corporis]|uniref:Geranylgeranyl pyrophosphate synthase, putative n=1 Tax=Pediculus humanus subsp. corporis TaxID=121224 RepID=E0VT01_PEDHC|nr:geranylgeranyl pyrophosphate synthase, putative [Pediculus humanus corporis]EEB16507.1 geranylgeranyl pyrophosphate synthase, putative [Pediculus humanus corporis]